MWTYQEADDYITNEVLHNSWWTEADEGKRQRALKNAENELYEVFSHYKPDTRPLPARAIYEQALWLLRKDDIVLRAEQGVTNVNLSGAIQVTVSGASTRISPAVMRIVGRKKGRYR